MRASKLRLFVAAALVAGAAGCSLPEVRPLAGGTTAGPSPYGPWYEQHWATNAVLLAAADEAKSGAPAPAPAAATTEPAATETAAGTSEETAAPAEASAKDAAEAAKTEAPPAIEGNDGSADAAPAKREEAEKPAPASGGPVRY